MGRPCHRPIYHVSLRAGVTEVSSFESYDDDYPLYLGELDADRGVFPPREKPWVLNPDLVE
jgi:hypothetical protein